MTDAAGGAERSGRGLRIVLLGDGAWAADTLTRLHGGRHTVVGVVVRVRPSDARLLDAARTLGVPVLQPARVNDPAAVAWIAGLAPDLGISVAYDQILRPALLSVPTHGCVNLHAGMLPHYRGRNVVNWAILNGEREIGVTAHRIDEGIDTGDILLQRALPIGWTDGYGDVLARVVAAIPPFVEEVVELVATGRCAPRPQRDLPGTYFGGREPGDEWLDWSDSSVNLHNKVRAITRPGPGALTLLGDRRVVVWRAYFDPAWPRYIATPGQVVGRQADGVVVKTGDSTLVLQEVEVDGEPCGPPRWRVGTRLGINLAAAVPALLQMLARSTHDDALTSRRV